MKATETSVRATPLAAEAASPVGSRWAWTICAVAVLSGIGLRFANLGRESLWLDEGYTAWAVSNPVPEIIRIIRVDTAPPLFYILLRGWTHLFGFSEAALRSMSALMGSIGLLFFVGIARRLLKSPWAVAAAVSLFSFSFMQIAYAHEARFYAMMTMMGAIDLYLVLLVCERSTILRLIALCFAWSISLWTNNLMAVYLAGLGIGWLILPGERTVMGRLKDAVIVTLISGLTFVPWVPAVLAQTRQIQSGFWPSAPDRWLLYRTIGVMAGVDEQSLPRGDWHRFFEVDVILLCLTLLGFLTKSSRRAVVGMFSFGILPILLIFIYSRIGQSIFMERAFLASGIAVPLLIVLPMKAGRPGRALSMAAIVLFLYLSLRSIPNHRLGEHAEKWREACAFAQSSNAAHRLIVCVSSDGEPLCRYYACDRDYGPRTDVTAAPATFFALDPPRTMQRIKSDRDLDGLRAKLALGGFDEVVLLSSHTFWADHTERALAMMKGELSETDEKYFTGVTVYRFKPSPQK